ncbi:hypothetical protein R6Q57_008801 [Mikania cordata]
MQGLLNVRLTSKQVRPSQNGSWLNRFRGSSIKRERFVTLRFAGSATGLFGLHRFIGSTPAKEGSAEGCCWPKVRFAAMQLASQGSATMHHEPVCVHRPHPALNPVLDHSCPVTTYSQGSRKGLGSKKGVGVRLNISSTNEATSSPQEYWRSIMKDEPIPKTIQDVLPLEDGIKVNENTFIRNFDLKPNLIIYRSHVVYSAENHHIVSSSSTFDELN